MESAHKESSHERISSPEQLNECIRVTRPSVWIILSGILIMLIGIIIWAIFGVLTTQIETYGFVRNGSIICFADNISGVDIGAPIITSNAEYYVTEISQTPVSYDEAIEAINNDYYCYLMGLGKWNYVIYARAAELPDGIIKLAIITERIKPISYLFN